MTDSDMIQLVRPTKEEGPTDTSETGLTMNQQMLTEYHPQTSSMHHQAGATTLQPRSGTTIYVSSYPRLTKHPSTRDTPEAVLGFSICACLCCFAPFGLVAIILTITAMRRRRENPMQAFKFKAVAVLFNLFAILAGFVCWFLIIVYRDSVLSFNDTVSTQVIDNS